MNKISLISHVIASAAQQSKSRSSAISAVKIAAVAKLLRKDSKQNPHSVTVIASEARQSKSHYSVIASIARQSKLLLLAPLLLATNASALELNASLNVGVEHSDNVSAQAQNPQSDLKTIVGAAINASHNSGGLESSANYQFTKTFYKEDSTDDQSSVTGSAKFYYEQIANQLYWTLENTRKSTIKDKAQGDTEENRDDRSITTIRPDYIFRPSSVDTVTTNLSFTDIRYQDASDQDSTRLGAQVNWQHALSKIDSVSAVLSFNDVKFDNEISDYEYYRATLSYQAELSRLSYSLAAGYNQSSGDLSDYGGNYFSADASYKHSGSSWAVSALQELSDTSRGDNNDGLSESNSSTSSTDVDVFERQSVELSYENENICGGCVVGVYAIAENEDYETIPRDNRENQLGANFSYQWTRAISINSKISWSEVAFINGTPGTDYENNTYQAGLNWKLSKHAGLRFNITFDDRDYEIDTQDYDELSGGISFNYLFN